MFAVPGLSWDMTAKSANPTAHNSACAFSGKRKGTFKKHKENREPPGVSSDLPQPEQALFGARQSQQSGALPGVTIASFRLSAAAGVCTLDLL